MGKDRCHWSMTYDDEGQLLRRSIMTKVNTDEAHANKVYTYAGKPLKNNRNCWRTIETAELGQCRLRSMPIKVNADEGEGQWQRSRAHDRQLPIKVRDDEEEGQWRRGSIKKGQWRGWMLYLKAQIRRWPSKNRSLIWRSLLVLDIPILNQYHTIYQLGTNLLLLGQNHTRTSSGDPRSPSQVWTFFSFST